jgi:hypothetical protein
MRPGATMMFPFQAVGAVDRMAMTAPAANKSWRVYPARTDATGSSILAEDRESKMKLQLVACALALTLGSSARGQAPAVVKTPADLGNRTGKFKAGDMAPDFNLKVMHKETRIMLSSYRNKRPVALVFGSYT